MLAGTKASAAEPAPADRRFSSREWRDNPYYDYLRQSYLLAAKYVEELVESAALEPVEKERTRFGRAPVDSTPCRRRISPPPTRRHCAWRSRPRARA